MNGYNFTERVRKVLALAREEAARLHHESRRTDHIPLGLIRGGGARAAAGPPDRRLSSVDEADELGEDAQREAAR